MHILPLFACFELLLPNVSVRQLASVAQTVLTMTGRITLLWISRWTEKGGSYRTVHRFFATVLPWSEMFAGFFAIHLFNSQHEYILAGDETVVSKAGNQTFGVERFFSGLKGKVIRAVSFFVLSLGDTKERKSYPLLVKQTVKSESAKKFRKSLPKKRKAAKGRAKESRNRDKNAPQVVA